MKEEKVKPWTVIKNLYAQLDRAMEKHLSHFKFSCKKGCYGCCHLFVSCGLLEGVAVAQYLIQRPDWKTWLPRIRKHALDYEFNGVGHVTYFAKSVRCVFLTEENTCDVYPVRPGACRYHYVVTPAEDCYPGAVRKTAKIDTSELEDRIFALDTEIMGAIGGPLPIMVAEGFRLIVGAGPASAYVDEAFAGISAQLWLERHMESFITQHFAAQREVVQYEDLDEENIEDAHS